MEEGNFSKAHRDPVPLGKTALSQLVVLMRRMKGDISHEIKSFHVLSFKYLLCFPTCQQVIFRKFIYSIVYCFHQFFPEPWLYLNVINDLHCVPQVVELLVCVVSIKTVNYFKYEKFKQLLSQVGEQ